MKADKINKPMRVAVHNEFFGKYCAETELARRICLAGINIGWEIVEVGSSQAINDFNPDFVLVLHFGTPKITGFPTYGCMWNPISFFEQPWCDTEKSQKNILSYDGYLSSSPQIDTWLRDILYGTDKKYFICPDFYTSCHQTTYQPPQLKNPQLVYIGTNWDGWRYQEIFEGLDQESYMQIYGAQAAWEYLQFSYKGQLPFDGESVISTLNQAGLGLCLHKQEHIDDAVPSMRIFEIVASGAIAICGEHPFIKKAFGDSVFYINSDLAPQTQVLQISRYIKWVKNNQQKAIEMSKNAHQILTEKYSLEKSLLNIVSYHQKLIIEKGFTRTEDIEDKIQKLVQIIVRIGSRNEETVLRCLDSIASQTYKNIAVVLVVYEKVLYLNTLIERYADSLKLNIINSEISGFRSTQLMAGLKAITADFFGILDDDDVIYPNHIYSLVNILDRSEEIGVAYSGSIQAWESDELTSNLKSSNLAHFEPFNINRILDFDNFITSNSFVARTELMEKYMLEDPRLEVAEHIFLLMNLCRKCNFRFSYESTCEFYWRSSMKDNSIFTNQKAWSNSINRIRTMFWKKDFPQTQFIVNVSLNNLIVESCKDKDLTVKVNNIYDTEELVSSSDNNEENNLLIIEDLQDQLNNAINTIESMKSTKFWKLRKQWFKLKKIVGLSE